jgi:hypothetical protein
MRGAGGARSWLRLLGLLVVGLIGRAIHRRRRSNPSPERTLDARAITSAPDVRQPLQAKGRSSHRNVRKLGYLAAPAFSVSLLLSLGVLASAIDTGESQFPESIYWPDQPSAQIGVFLSRSNTDLLNRTYGSVTNCVSRWSEESGSEVDPAYLNPAGWKVSLSGLESESLTGVVGFGRKKISDLDGITTSMTDVATVPGRCFLGGAEVEALHVPAGFSYVVTGSIVDIYKDARYRGESCASWTTASGEQKTSFPTTSKSGDRLSVSCVIDEGDAVTDIHLSLPIVINNHAAGANLAGYSTWVVNNLGDTQLMARESQGSVFVVPAEFEAMLSAGPGSQIVSTLPGELAFGTRQYAYASLTPGESILVRSAVTVLRSIGAVVRQFSWMAMGVVAGLLVVQAPRTLAKFTDEGKRKS